MTTKTLAPLPGAEDNEGAIPAPEALTEAGAKTEDLTPTMDSPPVEDEAGATPSHDPGPTVVNGLSYIAETTINPNMAAMIAVRITQR